nr:MAG TPA: hypothetical protein [Caudoviricetes sp.]
MSMAISNEYKRVKLKKFFVWEIGVTKVLY